MRIARLALSLMLLGSAAFASELREISRFDWRESLESFGGLSGLVVSQDGQHLTALSDRAWLFEAALERDAAGAITRIELLHARPLLDQDGQPLVHPRADSEDLALGPDGALYVSFEGDARIRIENGPSGLPEVLPRHAPFADLPSNTALEALAIDAAGALYVLPEGATDGAFTAYRLKDGDWEEIFRLPQEGRIWRISGADIGPDSRLYVLERAFLGVGFRSRVRRMALDGSQVETLLLSGLGQYGNLEGISVWGTPSALRMSLISDDNFTALLPSQIVEFRIGN